MESILAAQGLEQSERLAVFLPTARPADLERLYLGLEEQKNPFLHETIGDALFLRWMSVDPEGGIAFAKQRGWGGMAWSAWGKVDPEAAVAAALTSKDLWAGAAVVGAIGRGDPARAQELLDRHPQWRTAQALTGLAAGLMRTDPAAGASMMAATNESLDEGKLVSTWARRDPEAALSWAQSLPDQARRGEALRVLIDQWAKTDPDRIASTLTTLPEGRTKWQLYASHAARLAVTDPAAALAWAQAAPTAGLRRQAQLEVARGLAGSNPAGALDILRSLDLSSVGDMSAMSAWRETYPQGATVAGGYSAHDTIATVAAKAPEATVEFFAGLSLGTETKGLAQTAFRTWMQRDSMAASEWLAGQPAGAVKESATRVLVGELSRGAEPDFDAALRWALTLPTGSNQREVRAVILSWRRRDASAARAALEHPGVPAGLRESLGRAFSTP